MWYRYCSNLFGKMRRNANFGNTVTEILTKRGERREKWWDRGEKKKKKNFGDVVAKIGEKKLSEKKMKNSITGLPEFICPWPTKTTQPVSFNFDVSTVSFI